ncbi:TPA: hypothetical protein IAC10_05700 [Candidatus Scatousia excrementigallinarum]|uniref:Uncharacterized protein n=1 Tax=Candidatus Scatousia excrementigallinarum TaxID=2840935 RepID=A0A9D1JMN9_9BACT|nr:hypothetical protein [Candidatus Scatousia excrementigallinarum]
MNTLKVAGKFLDQPMLVAKFHNAVPAILTTAATAYTVKEVSNEPQHKRKKAAVRIGATMALTVASALAAPKITNKIFKEADEIPKTMKELKIQASGLVEDFLKKNHVDDKTKELLEKAKTNVLKFKEVKTLFKKFEKNTEGKKLLNNLIPDPENIDSKEIFSEIGRLSVFGLIPVLGGITGGIIGDKLTTKNWKKRIPDKIKEGSYQYLANIFLCNIGAGGALAIMEKFNIKSKAARAGGMVAGIITTGVIGGSAIANLIGNKIINPMFEHGHKDKHKKEHLFDERKPEPLDIGLHTDDIATVAVMSGLKWIEPALPLMYSVSGYRAGIGYRNGNKTHNN